MVVALSTLYVVVAQTTARLTTPGPAGTTFDAAIVAVGGTLVFVLPVLWVGARAVDGLSGPTGHLGANGYAAVLCLVVFWTRLVPAGRGGGTVGSPLPVSNATTAVVLTAGLAVGGAVSLWLAWSDDSTATRQEEPRRSATRTADRPGSPDPDGDGRSTPPDLERRTALRMAGGVGVTVLGGVVVGRDLAVDYSCCIPLVQFDFAYDGGTTTVTHVGGDTITAENTRRLLVVVGDEETGWPLPASAADFVTVDVAPGDTVEVIWVSPGGEQTQVLADFAVPR